MRRIIFISIIFVLCLNTAGFAFWIWTPKTRKWINPKNAVKLSPEQQLDFAVGLLNQDDLKEAQAEFNKILNHYPRSKQAAEAQYYLGVIEEKRDKLYEAYLAYQKVIDKYPFSSRINEIIEKEFRIAGEFMRGRKRKALGITLPVENPAVEILRQVIDNSTFGPLAPEAQYKLGLILKILDRFPEAEQEFEMVIKNYPQSQWVAPAKFQIASCQARMSSSPDYDQELTRQARQKFEEFIEVHPDAELSKQAEKNLRELKDREAKGDYDIAAFYEKQKAFDAAKIYYSSVVNEYPNSIWAAKALSKLQSIEIEQDKK